MYKIRVFWDNGESEPATEPYEGDREYTEVLVGRNWVAFIDCSLFHDKNES